MFGGEGVMNEKLVQDPRNTIASKPQATGMYLWCATMSSLSVWNTISQE
jgi:hypothetical protein